MKLLLSLEREDLMRLQTSIIVECWDRKWSSFTFKRKLKETFTPHEINKIRKYHRIFYDWYLQTGVPNETTLFSFKEVQFIQKVVNFFATN